MSGICIICVRRCNTYSDFFDYAVSLKQGEVMSSLLFSLFVEDLELFLQNDQCYGFKIDEITFIFMHFADDMVILGKDRDNLQNSLDHLEHYCNKWGLQLNTDKTKVVVFRERGGFLNDVSCSYKGDNIEVVNDFDYLGTFLIILELSLSARDTCRQGAKSIILFIVQYRNVLPLT